MALVDLDNFIESLMWMWNGPETATFFNDLKLALDKQGLAYKDGKIIKTQRRISAEAKETGYGEPEDKEKPNGGIVLEDFNEGDGFYKVNLAYLSKEQVEEIENIAKKWNPELAESEDERIRKSLLRWVKSNSYTNIAGIQINDVITWLEKQGNNLIENGYTNNKDVIKYADNYSHAIWHKLMDNFKNIKDYHIGCNDVSDIVLNAIIDTYNWLEKQGKQNPADKIEPMFHKGDWIISNTANEDYRICKITDINNGYYTIESIYGYKGYNHFNVFEESYRLWTIQDAKEGDVLVASDESLFIFAKTKDNAAYYHYSLCKNGSQEISDGKHSWETASGSRPATKEQRELLFQKMHEAGYTFDFEKKELKKIKFRIGDEIRRKAPSSCDRDMQVARIEKDYYICNHIGKFSSEVIPFSKESSYELIEHKPIEWKQENREELTEFENAMMHIGGSFFGENAGLDPNDTDTIKEQAGLLLELAPKTEWGEEDEKMLNEIDFTFFEEKSIPNVKYWKFMNWLKSIKQRHIWKPSDEQMEALEHFIIHHNGSTNYAKDLEELRIQLKKLKGE